MVRTTCIVVPIILISRLWKCARCHSWWTGKHLLSLLPPVAALQEVLLHVLVLSTADDAMHGMSDEQDPAVSSPRILLLSIQDAGGGLYRSWQARLLSSLRLRRYPYIRTCWKNAATQSFEKRDVAFVSPVHTCFARRAGRANPMNFVALVTEKMRQYYVVEIMA